MKRLNGEKQKLNSALSYESKFSLFVVVRMKQTKEIKVLDSVGLCEIPEVFHCD